MKMRWSAGLPVIAGAVLMGAMVPVSARAQKVTTDYDHKAQFGDYKTFSIMKLQASDPLVEDRLREGLTSELTKRGLHQVPSGGDLEVTAIGSRGSQQEYNTFYDGLGGGGWGWGGWGRRGWGGWGGSGIETSSTTVEQVPVGTLRVDLYAEGTHQLVWRAIASDQLSNKPEKNTKKLNKALDKMFDKFPPKGAAQG